eukprot:TRINITY_DN55133_c0_g1_i1.p1 TRINITY_DN55133_c0_g1~~TRINITY_DN55133_c0_g1_i1.p1  ORF type:complete len:222 (-),score=12.60 TRINITY_DN55133_c0_g1_i1:127-792(-)
MSVFAGEIALPIGSTDLWAPEPPPPGCGELQNVVEHHPVKGQLAAVARQMFFTRKLAEEIAHQQPIDERVYHYAADVAKYANDLEFFTRQLGIAMNMPIMTKKPFLPVDLRGIPVSPTNFLLFEARGSIVFGGDSVTRTDMGTTGGTSRPEPSTLSRKDHSQPADIGRDSALPIFERCGDPSAVWPMCRCDLPQLTNICEGRCGGRDLDAKRRRHGLMGFL